MLDASAEPGLRDTVHLLIGGGGGIGACLARALNARGAKVCLAGRNREKADPVTGEFDCHWSEVDATDEKSVQRCIDAAREWGSRLDGIVNCAGSILLKPAHLTTMKEFEDVVSTNLRTAFVATKAAAKALREKGGSVVLMSSAAAQIGLANHEAIAAAKAGVEGLVRSAAATYAANGIRFNAIAPGLVDTPLSEKITSNENALKASTAMHPIGRIGRPEDLAEAICWLLSPSNSWVTGQIIGIDGGLATLKTSRVSRG